LVHGVVPPQVQDPALATVEQVNTNETVVRGLSWLPKANAATAIQAHALG